MELRSKNKTLNLDKPVIMGVLNLTPDSFSDGGRFNNKHNAFRQVEKMINSGASIIDIGGESTRPGSIPVSANEQLDRTQEILIDIRKRFDTWISVDTSEPKVIYESVANGADIINDVRALSLCKYPNKIFELGVPICLMHKKGETRNMQNNPYYDDVVKDIQEFFHEKLVSHSTFENQLIFDPGFGFGKRLQDNYEILANLSKFKIKKIPLLVGLSRKSMIYNTLKRKPDEVVIGSVSAAILSALNGANIIRVHDVPETSQALQIFNEYNQYK